MAVIEKENAFVTQEKYILTYSFFIKIVFFCFIFEICNLGVLRKQFGVNLTYQEFALK